MHQWRLWKAARARAVGSRGVGGEDGNGYGRISDPPLVLEGWDNRQLRLSRGGNLRGIA